MGKVLEFSPKPPSKFGFERVRKRKKGTEKPGQMNLFGSPVGHILRMPTNAGPFEEALVLDERNDRRAEEAYLRAISEGDSVADAYCNLGILESKAGRVAKAFDSFTRSLEHDPRHFESHFNLGNLYFDAGDLRLARMHYEMAVEVDPTFANLHFNLGLVHALNQDYPEAVATFTRYKELAPSREGVKADELLDGLKRSLSSRS